MELTGKAKEDFDKWWYSITNPALSGELHHFKVKTRCDVGIEDLTDSMKYGVYVDWFDSVGVTIVIDAGGIKYEENREVWYQSGVKGHKFNKATNTRQEARIKAIEKANEIYNNG